MRRHKSDRIIAVLTFLLIGVGLIVIYAIGPMWANSLNAAYNTDEYGENSFFIHQAISAVLSILVFIVAFKFPYQQIRKWSKLVLIAGLASCVVLWILSLVGSSLASCSLGACRWFNFGAVSFQPAELLKLGLTLYLPQLVVKCRQEGTMDSLKDFWLPYALSCGLSLLFVMVIQKDFGSSVPIVTIALAVLFMSGIPMKRFLLVLGVIGVAGVLAIVASPHRLERLATFSGDGDSDSNYQIENALMAIGSGGVFGVGIGNSVQATGYLPESINDSVFAVMGETFGFVGLVAILGCFLGLLLRLLRVSGRLPMEESLVVIGVFAWLGTHVIVNVAAMTGMIPLTGITLPLLSYGGTSMLFVAAALGLSLQLSCYTGREVKKYEDISSRRGVRGAHYTGRRRSA